MKLAPNATEEEIAYTEKWKDLIQLRLVEVWGGEGVGGEGVGRGRCGRGEE